MQSFQIINDDRAKMNVPYAAKSDPYTPWYFGSYVMVRLAMIAFHVDEAKSWLWFDSKLNGYILSF